MNDCNWRILGATVAVGATLLAGCKDARKEQFEGARRALTALPDVELVSGDAAAGVLTVRSRSSGELTTIDLGAKAPAGRVPAAAGAPAAGASAAAAAAAGDSADATAGASGATAPGLAAAGPTAGPGTADIPGTEDGATVAPGAPATATAATVAAANVGAPVVVRDPQGRVQVIEGSGFRIERAPASGATGGGATVPARTAPAGTRPPAGAASGLATAEGALRRLAVPVVCGAGETRSLQGVLVDVPGAGIVAERGCSLTLANVRVRSGGWGLVVNPGATVRIDDSVIEGRTGALDLHGDASLSAWATTFRGALGRPVAPPQFVDRGGNRWE